VPDNTAPLPDFTRWPSFPFEGAMRVKPLAAPVAVEPPRSGEDATDCVACNTPDDAYIWVSERWRVRAMDRPTGLPVVVILECRSHLDLGDLPNLLAAELGVMTVRLERSIRSLDGVARVHVNRWGDGAAHLHMWFLARPYGRLQLRGTFLSLWDDILPVIPEQQWRENLALVAAWLAEFGGTSMAEPAHIQWESPSTITFASQEEDEEGKNGSDAARSEIVPGRPTSLGDMESAQPAATSALPAQSPAQSAQTPAEPAPTGPHSASAPGEPSATNAHSAPTPTQPAATTSEAASTRGEPTLRAPQPPSTSGEPASTNAEPASTNAEPASTNAEPASTNAEPASTNAEPASTNAEPASTNAEPASPNAEPASPNAEPASMSAEPVPTAAENGARSDESQDDHSREPSSSGPS
jgi:hypothetical protein